MVEINNQRKAFLDMLAWSEGTITDVRNQKSWLWRHCRRRAIYWLPDHPRKLVTLNPKLKSTGAGRYQLLSRWWDAYRKQLGLKDFSPKSQDAVALQQTRSVALYLWLIVVISVRQSTVAAISGPTAAGAGYGQFEHKADSLIAKFKEAGGTVRRYWCMSRVTAIISALVICIIVRLSWAVNHYRDNAITYKAQRDKNARELKLANAAITDMQMRQRDVAALDAKYTKS